MARKTLDQQILESLTKTRREIEETRGPVAPGARFSWNREKEKEFLSIPIETLIDDDYFMGVKKTIYPKIREDLIEIWHRRRTEGVYIVGIASALGTGKSTLMAYLYWLLVYELICLCDPQDYFSLEVNTPIALICLNKTEDLAKEVTFTTVLGVFQGKKLRDEGGLWVPDQKAELRGFFHDYFPPSTVMDDNPKARFPKALKFPKHIHIFPGTASNATSLGWAVHSAIVDEANLLQITERSKMSRNKEGIYDAAQDLSETILGRIGSRFMKGGKPYGLICYISSPSYSGDFLSRLEEEAKYEKHIFCIRRAFWKVKPEELSPKTFDLDLTTNEIINLPEGVST